MSSVSENATVLLIGASRGLGYAIVAEYIEQGSQVVATVRGPEHEVRVGAVRARRRPREVDENLPPLA